MVVTCRATVRAVPGNVWTAEERAGALRVGAADGLATAYHATGVPKSTIRRWAAADGVTLAPTGDESRMESFQAAHRVTMAQRRARRVQLLAEVTDLALEATVKRLRKAKRDATGDVNVRELVGAWTRGIHDLQLLDGGPTERPAVPPVERGSDPAALLSGAQERLGVLRSLPGSEVG